MIEKILERLEEKKKEHLNDEEFCLKLEKTEASVFCSAKARAIDGAIEIVQEVAKEYGNGWIPVETELPKEHLWAEHMISEEVFVTFLDNNEKLRVDTDNTYDGKWHYYGDRVIAWMPKKLPSPYQKGESYE